MEAPVMEAEDKHFGFIGFESFDDAGKIDNNKTWELILPSKVIVFLNPPDEFLNRKSKELKP